MVTPRPTKPKAAARRAKRAENQTSSTSNSSSKAAKRTKARAAETTAKALTKKASASGGALTGPRAEVVSDGAASGGEQGHATDVRIVGIGASAGGLEALELFFDGMPVDSGLAFIVVQHLSPDFRSMMDELLARHSKMPIRHATDGMVFDPNTIYLNPPRQNLVIVDGRLRLKPVDDEQVPNLPIDAFFVSLAQELADKAIGVVLSAPEAMGHEGRRRSSGPGARCSCRTRIRQSSRTCRGPRSTRVWRR